MKKDEDYRIQEILDQKIKGINVPSEITDTEDFKAYELVHKLLKKEPVAHLPLSFKANVLRRIETEKKKMGDIRFYWLLGVVSFICFMAIISIFIIFKDAFTSVWVIAERFKGLVLIAIAAILAFNFVEKKSIKI